MKVRRGRYQKPIALAKLRLHEMTHNSILTIFRKKPDHVGRGSKASDQYYRSRAARGKLGRGREEGRGEALVGQKDHGGRGIN